jgi:hypothetical protein
MSTQRSEVTLRKLFVNSLPAESQRDCRFVWLSNFEAERFWVKPNTVQLPKFSQPDDVAIVNRLEEMNLFLAEGADAVILRAESDKGFLDYLSSLGYRLPKIIAVNPEDKQASISQALLANEQLCNQIANTAGSEGFFFLPFATTRLEEQIIEKTRLRNIGSTASVSEKINSKIYSRTISKELGLRTIKGWECDSLESIEKGFESASAELAAGQKFVLKESMGVSGKGLFIADSENKARQIVTLLKRKAKAGAEFAFVIESWVDKLKDINYQLFISASGDVELLTIKEILTEDGVHMGHKFPAALSNEQIDCYYEAAQLIGKRLFEDGYRGIAGVDSIIDRGGNVYPLLEINGRFNMSTYQLGLDRLIDPAAKVVAKHYPLLLKSALPFERLTDRIGADLLRASGSGSGVLIQNFATVNVNSNPSGEPFKGRLYTLLIGRDVEEIAQLDQRMAGRLQELQSAS